jgi:hypothetical protein
MINQGVNLYGILPLVTSFSVFIFGVISITRRPSIPLHKAFAGFCFTVTLWSFFYGLMYLNDPKYTLLFSRLGYKAVVYIPAFCFHFILLYTNLYRRNLVLLVYVISTCFLLITESNLFLRDATVFFWGPYPVAGKLYILFVMYFVAVFFGSVFFLFRSLNLGGRNNPIQYNQTKFMFLAFLFASTSVVDYLPNYGVEIYPFAYISTFIWISLIAYATLRYKLMDFNLLLRWGMAYVATLILVFATFAILALAVTNIVGRFSSIGAGVPLVLLLCLIVFIFEPIKDRVLKFVNHFVFKSPDLRSIVDAIDAQLKENETLEVKAANLIQHFKSIWKVDHAGFLMWDFKGAQFEFLPHGLYDEKRMAQIKEELGLSNYLIRTLETERRLFKYGIVIDDDVLALTNRSMPGEKMTFKKIHKSMQWLGASVCVPIMDQTRLMGLFVLGQKKNGEIFNEEDQKFLSHISERLSEYFKGRVLDVAVPA